MWLIQEYVFIIVFKGVKVEVLSYYGGQLVKFDIGSVWVQGVNWVLKWVYGCDVVFVCMGGSIFIVVDFDCIFQILVLFVDFGLNEDVLYLFNESFVVVDYYNGILMSVYLL